ncbi:MAG: hypothetical protein R2798_08470 [Chitinophagales bacterium]
MAFVLIFGYACKKQEIEISNSARLNVGEDVLSFENRAAFLDLYEELKVATDAEKETIFNRTYHENFTPLRNYDLEIAENADPLGIPYIDEETYYIGDDNFAALLNEEGKIVINDSIYAYTPNGLWYCSLTNEEILSRFLESDTYRNYQVPTGEDHSIVSFENINIHHFSNLPASISEYEEIDDVPVVIPPPTNCFNIQNTLTECTPYGNAFSVFGAQCICNEYFDSKHRVRTHFMNQNYGFFKIAMVNVKYQKKGLGWNKTKTNELCMTILDGYYEIHQPGFSMPTIPTNNNSNPLFNTYLAYYDNKIYNAWGVPIGTNNSYPFGLGLIDPEFSIQFYIPLFNIPITTTGAQVTNFFWQQAWSAATSVLFQLSQQDEVNGSEIIINAQNITMYNLKNYKEHCENCSELDKYFHNPFAVTLSFNNSGGSFTLGSAVPG